MNNNEETPSNLEGLGGGLSAEVLKNVNNLMKLLLQQGHSKQGSTVINYYADGSQHIDHVDNQYFIGKETLADPPCQEALASAPSLRREKKEVLSEVLSTEKAMVLWRKVQEAGYVDADYQPLISRTQSALLADAMAKQLGIKKKWKVFEGLWNRKNMYRDYYKALSLQQSLAFQDVIKKLLR